MIWLISILAGSLTFLERSSIILWLSNWQMPAWLQRALRFVPAAAFAAIAAPAVLHPDGGPLDLSPFNPRILAAIIALIVGRYTRNLSLTIIVGMVAFWLLAWILSAA